MESATPNSSEEQPQRRSKHVRGGVEEGFLPPVPWSVLVEGGPELTAFYLLVTKVTNDLKSKSIAETVESGAAKEAAEVEEVEEAEEPATVGEAEPEAGAAESEAEAVEPEAEAANPEADAVEPDTLVDSAAPIELLTQAMKAYHLAQDSLNEAHEADRAINKAAAARARRLDAARKHGERAVLLSEDSDAPTFNAGSKEHTKWSRSEIAFRGFVPMVAAELRITEPAAEKLIITSRSLISDYPAFLAILEEGDTSWAHVELLVSHGHKVPDEYRDAYESSLLRAAQEMTAPQFDRKARREADKYVEEALEVRHREAVKRRSVTLVPADDGMAELNLYLEAADAVAIYNRVTEISRGVKDPADGRTLTQVRADVATRLLRDGITTTPGAPAPGETYDAMSEFASSGDIGGADAGYEGLTAGFDPANVGKNKSLSARKGLGVGIVATVAIHVPVLRLLADINAEHNSAEHNNNADHNNTGQDGGGVTATAGPGAETAELEGYGPISMDRARELAGTAATFIRILTDPETGTILSVGRKRYRVPAAMRLFLMTRDQTCRFPGCMVPARFCHLDHTKDWEEGGPTETTNLASTCEQHHRLKHQTGWSYTQDDKGVCTWTSPTGATYITYPAKRIKAAPVATNDPAKSIWDREGDAGEIINPEQLDDNPTPPGWHPPELPF